MGLATEFVAQLNSNLFNKHRETNLMQVQSTGQLTLREQLQQTQQTQLRRMDGSGNGQGNRDATASVPELSQSQLSAGRTFSTYA